MEGSRSVDHSDVWSGLSISQSVVWAGVSVTESFGWFVVGMIGLLVVNKFCV